MWRSVVGSVLITFLLQIFFLKYAFAYENCWLLLATISNNGLTYLGICIIIMVINLTK